MKPLKTHLDRNLLIKSFPYIPAILKLDCCIFYLHNLIFKIVKIILQILIKKKDAIDYVYVSTPAAHECYLNARQGAGYGLDHVRERFDVYQSSVLRPDSGVKGK